MRKIKPIEDKITGYVLHNKEAGVYYSRVLGDGWTHSRVDAAVFPPDGAEARQMAKNLPGKIEVLAEGTEVCDSLVLHVILSEVVSRLDDFSKEEGSYEALTALDESLLDKRILKELATAQWAATSTKRREAQVRLAALVLTSIHMSDLRIEKVALNAQAKKGSFLVRAKAKG